ncbi:MAG: anthranilate synthase component I family protein [Pirellulaceae bacterium]
MTAEANQLPHVRQLTANFSLEKAFAVLCKLPGCLWLDSASRSLPSSGRSIEQTHLDRYSFLTADPIRQLVASVGDPNPWPELHRWAKELPTALRADLPPFQGGLAGLIGYEAGAWLEDIPIARDNDLPTPAMSIGLYDWTIAVDHENSNAYLVSQGITADGSVLLSAAIERADQIESLLGDCNGESTAPQVESSTKQSHDYRADTPSNFTSDEFRAAVADIVHRIRQGDCFQVNLAQRLLRAADCPPPELYRRLRQSNPAPFGAYYDGGSFAVLSSSPEGFLSVRDSLVETRPIKGTISRTGNAHLDALLAEQLRDSAKDRAENVMIVDLMRNDLSRVCADESVVVTKLCQIERYQYVQHLVSVVQGRLRDDASVVDLLQACFPGGSITGAPKIEAMRVIAELEPNPRGPYCGSLGYISCGISTGGAADFNILIRTITATQNHWQIPVGGGITARSIPKAEESETWAKAEGMLRAVAARKDDHGTEEEG